jgi:hypothetical protein
MQYANRFGAALAIVTVLLLPAALGAEDEKNASPQDAGDARLVVVQDESSMERIIERYLIDKHQLTVQEKVSKDDKDDLYLDLPFKAGMTPKFRMSIDTQVLNRDDKTNKVIERGILINLYSGIMVPPQRRAAVLEVINHCNKQKAFASVYIDDDGEIICCWILNVLDDGLHPEYVFDVVARLDKIWRGLYPEVKKEMPD